MSPLEDALGSFLIELRQEDDLPAVQRVVVRDVEEGLQQVSRPRDIGRDPAAEVGDPELLEDGARGAAGLVQVTEEPLGADAAAGVEFVRAVAGL
jgi:hypothetical protein